MAQQALTRYQPDQSQTGHSETGDFHRAPMIDLFALAVPHFVMAIAVWRLVSRPDLDDDPALPRDPSQAQRPSERGRQP
jgi:hypothetical protein